MTQGHDHRLSKSGEVLGETIWPHAANYDYTRHLTRCGWAWEFLRRNKRYVEDWGVVGGEVTMLTGQGKPETLSLGTGASQMHRWGLIFRRRT